METENTEQNMHNNIDKHNKQSYISPRDTKWNRY